MLLQVTILSLFLALLLRSTHTHGYLLPTKSLVRSSLRATVENKTDEIFLHKHICTVCSEEFHSRNALFRHLRNSDCALANGGKISLYTMKRNDVAILLGYDAHIHVPPDVVTEVHYECDANKIGTLIENFVDLVLKKSYQKEVEIGGDELTPCVLSKTQSSVAKLRHSSLSQEDGVPAVGDVMILSYKYPVRKSLEKENEKFQENEKHLHLESLVQNVKKHLHDVDYGTLPFSGSVSNIEILAAESLSTKSKLHAETDCTQKAYHYLLPLRWLKGGKETESWCIENMVEAMNEDKISFTDGRGLGRLAKAKVPPPNQTLRELKEHLRSAECQRNDNRQGDNLAVGRYGVLGLKARRAFHNFADIALKGDASPNNKPVWRVLDRCRIVQQLPFTDETGDTHIILVISFCGDEFLPHQVRKIIGSAVAMTNKVLPPNFIETAMLPEVFLEAPLAPANNMYLADAKFHFHQLIEGKKLFEDPNMENHSNVEPVHVIHRRMLRRILSQKRQIEDSAWLEELEHCIAPRIRYQLSKLESVSNEVPKHSNDSENHHTLIKTPSIYSYTLTLLRQIVSDGRWPSTSIARSKVIKREYKSKSNDDDEQMITSGSFTIVNPKFDNGKMLKNNRVRTPLGNALFPDLVEAIFSLEEVLSKDLCTHRPPSSHCAVNRNAQFTPHVDSGRGSGQSLSMIVGLGDYYGGELLIEGEENDIRYLPLEFDGWRLRHWTANYSGERFSLVWFTPEI